MGIEIFQIGNGTIAAQVLITSDETWSSALVVQGKQRVNIGIRVGNVNSDILSAAGMASATASTFSGVVTVQRRMAEETEAYHWRDVTEWTIAVTDGADGSSENITDKPEPETCEYRVGVKTSDYSAGAAILRLGVG